MAIIFIDHIFVRRWYFCFSTYIGTYKLTFILLGFDMRELKSSVTHSLCNQNFTSPIHWPKATNFSKTATHANDAIDFGPGGLSGIGPLTVRNLDGHGVHVIVTGDKGKGYGCLNSTNKKFRNILQ